MHENNLYHSNTNQETYYINKKFSDLNEELQNKDKFIMSLNKQIMLLENYKIQIENLKRQNQIFEDKIRENENENSKNSIFYSEQLNQVINILH